MARLLKSIGSTQGTRKLLEEFNGELYKAKD